MQLFENVTIAGHKVDKILQRAYKYGFDSDNVKLNYLNFRLNFFETIFWKFILKEEQQLNNLIKYAVWRGIFDRKFNFDRTKNIVDGRLREAIMSHIVIGKKCYLEGYKQHEDLFFKFLTESMNFKKKEIEQLKIDFEKYLNKPKELTIEYGEEIAKNIFYFAEHDKFNTFQKDILSIYKNLTEPEDTIIIQKPRQKGISTILKIICFGEAQNGKNILYASHYDNHYLNLSNVTYKNLSHDTKLSENLLKEKYDLIIIDEINQIKEPLNPEHFLRKALAENGKLIISFTPETPEWHAYNRVKNFYDEINKTTTDETPHRVIYTIHPSDRDIQLAEQNPNRRNEFLGQFID